MPRNKGLPFPVVIPRLLCGTIRLEPCILNGDSIRAPDALLLHGHSVQIPFAPAIGPDRLPQLLAGIVHAGVHALSLLAHALMLLAPKQLPRAVDRPVAQVSLPGHPQRRRGRREHVLPEGLDALEVFRLGGLAALADGLCPRAGLGRRLASHGGCGG